jgi:hypothetical protein
MEIFIYAADVSRKKQIKLVSFMEYSWELMAFKKHTKNSNWTPLGRKSKKLFLTGNFQNGIHSPKTVPKFNSAILFITSIPKSRKK